MRRVLMTVACLLVSLAEARVSDVAQVPTEPGCKCWWFDHFEGLKEKAKTSDCKVVFLGDSITHFWTDGNRGGKVWEANFAKGEYAALNFGICGDRTEHVLWRLAHGQFDVLKPKAIVLMIGTNNTGHHHPWEADQAPVDTIAGIRAVLLKLREVCPEAKIILHPIFPRGEKVDDPHRVANDTVNRMIKVWADGKHIAWCDFNSRLVTADGTLTKEMADDFLHIQTAGYRIWAEEVKPYLDWALGKTDKLPAAKNPPAPTTLAKEGLDSPVDSYGNFTWVEKGRFQEKRAEVFANQSRWFDLVMVGDSITHGWDDTGVEVRDRRFRGYKVLNLGFSGDTVQNANWACCEGGALDGFGCRYVMVMIGTNNSTVPAEDVAAGIKRLVGIIRQKQPQATVLLSPIFPRGEKPTDVLRVKNDKTNEIIRKLADGKKVLWLDFGAKLTQPDGTIAKTMMNDFLHPTAVGYEIWADALMPYLQAK